MILFHATRHDLAGQVQLLPPALTGTAPERDVPCSRECSSARVTRVHLAETLDLAHFYGRTIIGPDGYRIYTVVADDHATTRVAPGCFTAASARIARLVWTPDISLSAPPGLTQRRFSSTDTPLLTVAEVSSSTWTQSWSSPELPAHLTGMNHRTAAAGHIAFSRTDMARISIATRREGYAPVDPHQLTLFDLPRHVVLCPLRSIRTSHRIGALLDHAKTAAFDPVPVG